MSWKPAYKRFGFCLQFKYLLPEKVGFAYLKVTLNSDNDENVIWKLKGYHGSEWSLAQVSWRPSRSSKVILYLDWAQTKQIDQCIYVSRKAIEQIRTKTNHSGVDYRNVLPHSEKHIIISIHSIIILSDDDALYHFGNVRNKSFRPVRLVYHTFIFYIKILTYFRRIRRIMLSTVMLPKASTYYPSNYLLDLFLTLSIHNRDSFNWL